MHLDEVQRARIFATSVVIFCVVVVAPLLLMKADPVARNIHFAGLAVALAGSVWVLLVLRNPAAYRTWIVTVFAGTVSIAIVSGYYYWGVLSSGILVTPIVMYYFAVNQSFKPAIVVFALGCLPHGLLGVLIAFGVLPNHAVIRPVNLQTSEQIAMIAIAQFVFVIAFVLARGFRNSISIAIEQLDRALRGLSKGKALLDEAEEELAQRAQQVGGPGRYTDQIVGSYRLGNVLGRGAMGEVYEATHETTGAPAAAKLLPPAANADPKIVRRFLREVEIAASLEAPNVVSVFEVCDRFAPIPFFIMERLQGENLAEMLRGRPRIHVDDVVCMMRDMAAGVDAAHRAGIIHRDLKPRNLFFHKLPDSLGVWKVFDFGVSRLAGTSGTLTQGHIVGTPSYMAPEQARGQKVDHRADIHAMGLIAYRTLTGRPAFGGSDIPAILYAVTHNMPPRPSEMTTLPTALDDVLAIALAKNPQERFDTATELAEAIAAAGPGRRAPRAGQKGPGEALLGQLVVATPRCRGGSLGHSPTAMGESTGARGDLHAWRPHRGTGWPVRRALPPHAGQPGRRPAVEPRDQPAGLSVHAVRCELQHPALVLFPPLPRGGPFHTRSGAITLAGDRCGDHAVPVLSAAWTGTRVSLRRGQAPRPRPLPRHRRHQPGARRGRALFLCVAPGVVTTPSAVVARRSDLPNVGPNL